jgi:ferrous iron transport protein B
MGKSIEPIIKPIGFDWKIGISLITSFAAREVFVGSMATIYSVHQEDNRGLLQTMKAEKNSLGKPVYSLATGLSLMVFYVYAMQCMATLAIVKRETKSWKWPLIQLAYMGVLAYVASYIVYQIFS